MLRGARGASSATKLRAERPACLRPRKADPSVAPSTGPTFAEAVARAMNCPGPASDTRRPVSAAGAATFHLKVTSVGRAGAAQEPDGPGPCEAPSRATSGLHRA